MLRSAPPGISVEEKQEQNFLHELSSLRAAWQSSLPKLLHRSSFRAAPVPLQKSMLYSLQAGGKRLRPILVLKSAQVSGLKKSSALLVAAGVESLHTYSLIHDDLPSMDNDDLRRGKPTNHKVFGEGEALLSGDALQSLAFEFLALAQAPPSAVAYFSVCVGAAGMVGGQHLDMNPPERGKGVNKTDAQHTFLSDLHRRKTGRLLEASLSLPFLILAGEGGEAKARIKKIKSWGLELGLLFQITDDILDHLGTTDTLGKTAGKDVHQNKLTFVSLFGLSGAREHAQALGKRLAHAAPSLFSGDPFFSYLPVYVLNRKS